MTRQQVRSLKRALRPSQREDATQHDKMLARNSSLALLARSIRFGHERLAILRLVMAVELGANVAAEHWEYCSRVAETSEDDRLIELYRGAVSSAIGGTSERTR